MTEQEWLECTNPDHMTWFIHRNQSDRKWRLLGVACCRRIWHVITENECRRVVDAAEQFADGLLSVEQMQAVALDAVDCGYRLHYDPLRHRAYACTDALGR